MNEIEKVLESDERIEWRGKPEFLPYIFGGGTIGMLIFGIMWLGFISLFFIVPYDSKSTGLPIFESLFLTIFVLVGLGMIFGPGISNGFSHKNIEYVATNKRLITSSGSFSRNIQSAPYSNDLSIDVQIGFFDNLFGGKTGTLFVRSGMLGKIFGAFPIVDNIQKAGINFGAYNQVNNSFFIVFRNIQNPYEVLKIIQREIEYSKPKQ